MSFALLPEFFVFLGVDVFVAMSLLTCLLDDYFPKTLPYVFQAAAIGGYAHLLISREFLVVFGDPMRFWSDYASQAASGYLFPVAVLSSALVLGLSAAVLLSSKVMGRSLKRR
jgi:hypothetical protein